MALRAWDSVLFEYCISNEILIASLVWHLESGIQSWWSLIANGRIDTFQDLVMELVFTTESGPPPSPSQYRVNMMLKKSSILNNVCLL